MNKVLKRKIASTSNQFNIWESAVQLNNGKVVKWEQVELKSANESVMVLPLTDKKEIILIEKFCTASQTLELVLPGGKIEKGLSQKETAVKEMIEEIGYKPNKITELGHLKVLPAYFVGTTYGFLAQDLVSSHKYKDHECEVNKIVFLNIDTILDKIKKQEIRDCRTVALILYYKQFVL